MPRLAASYAHLNDELVLSCIISGEVTVKSKLIIGDNSPGRPENSCNVNGILILLGFKRPRGFL